MPPGIVEGDRRKSRLISFVLVMLLFVMYTVKLSFPHDRIHITRQELKTNTENPEVENERLKSLPNIKPHPKPVPHHNERFNGTIVDKVAVIIEDRARSNLIPLILHFSSVLGPSWPVIIYTSSEKVGLFSTSRALERHLNTSTIQIRTLPQTVLFTNSDSVSSFLTKAWLWEELAPAKWVLIFQSDSMLCSNSARSVEDFFEYDFIGAPFAPNLGVGMNGGLSLRKRETLLKILEDNDWETDKGRRFEDSWYFDILAKMMASEEAEGITNGVKLPSMEVARTFSVETVNYPHPLGVHQVGRWLTENVNSLDDWCPEYKMCSADYIKDTATGH